VTTPVPYVQGVQTPAATVQPALFAQFTRRMRFPAQSPTAIAFGSSNQVQLKKTGIIASLEVRVAGNVVIGGTIGTTTMGYEWPLNLLKGLKVSVNGQSTLIDVRGLDLKVNEFMSERDVNDRGVLQRYGNATAVQQGTLSLSSDNWGGTGAAANFMAPGLNIAAIGTYAVDITYVVPIAANQVNLIGSVFGQSQATNINAEFTWGAQTDLFSAVGGAATVSFTGVNFDVTAVAYSVPVVQGTSILPDLSMLHGLNHVGLPITTTGDVELLLPGTGAGRSLLRLYYNVYSGAAPAAVPLVMNDTNFGNAAYKWGANDVPEIVPSGQKLRAINERSYNDDIGGAWGYGCWDFVNEYAARDIIDLGQTSDFRLLVNLKNAPTAGVVHVTQETLFSAAVGA
jgi:hypothetical protein